MQFDLSEKEVAKLAEWTKEVYAKGVELQRATVVDPDPDTYGFCWENGFPYTGAIGGQFTYSITPTSIGTIVVVEDAVTGEELDITDYGMF